MADSDIEKRLLLSSETPKLGSDRPILSPTRLSGQRPARQLAFKLCLALFCFLAGIGFASTVGLPASRLTVAQRASEWMRTTLYGEREIVIEVDRPIKKFDKSQLLRSLTPQASFKDNLLPDVRYITSLAYGGFSNQLYALEHLVYLAKLLNRPPVLPALSSISDHTPGGRAIRLSEVIDLDYLYTQTELPYIEWSDLKPIGEFGWDVGLAELQQQDKYAYGNVIGYWPMVTQDQKEARASPATAFGEAAYAEGIAAWANNQAGLDAAVEEERKRRVNETNPLQLIEPVDNLLCIDNLFFAPSLGDKAILPSEQEATELRGSRSWRQVGQHMRFTSAWEDLAASYLRQILSLTTNADIPPFLAVHIRRGDFKQARGFTPIERYVEAVSEVRRQLAQAPTPTQLHRYPRQGYIDWHHSRSDPSRLRIVVATDEEDPAFLSQMRTELGWIVIDHAALKTKERHGPWASSILDSIILSRAIGFAGTPWSTYSGLSALRVRSWNGGIALDAEA